jgi:hypothetical protein
MGSESGGLSPWIQKANEEKNLKIMNTKFTTKMLKVLPVICGFATMVASPAYASTTYSIDFGTPTKIAGNAATYTISSTPNAIFSAYGYTTGGAPVNVFAKNDGGAEVGLGLTNDGSGEDEITPGNFIQLNLTSLALYGATSVTLQVSSLTGTDAFQFYSGKTAGQEGTAVAGDSGNGTSNATNGISTLSYTFALSPTGNDYISLAATAGNVLLGPGSIYGNIATPEPASFGMIGLALFGLGLAGRRKFQSSKN